MSSISFEEVPNATRVPGMYIEIDNSLANSAEEQQIVLVIGAALTGAATPANTVKLCMDETKAKALFSTDEVQSDIELMVEYFRKQDKMMSIYAISATDVEGIKPALEALGDKQYHHIICTFNDEANIKEMEEFLEERYKAMEQIPGLAYIPKQGNLEDLKTFGTKSNCPLINFMAINELRTAAKEPLSAAAAIGAWVGQIAPSLANDPCRPLQTLKLNGVYSKADREFNQAERNLLLHNGMSTYTVTAAQDVLVERPITAYTNVNGITDNSYLDIMTPATAMYIRQKQRSQILSKYGRHKIAKNGTRFAPGQVIVTPNMFKSELLSLYRDLEYKGIVQDFDGYKQSLIVELDSTNKQRINYQDSPQFVNGLIIVAGKMQFRK